MHLHLLRAGSMQLKTCVCVCIWLVCVLCITKCVKMTARVTCSGPNYPVNFLNPQKGSQKYTPKSQIGGPVPGPGTGPSSDPRGQVTKSRSGRPGRAEPSRTEPSRAEPSRYGVYIHKIINFAPPVVSYKTVLELIGRSHIYYI